MSILEGVRQGWLVDGELNGEHVYAQLLALRLKTLRTQMENGGVSAIESPILDSSLRATLQLAALKKMSLPEFMRLFSLSSLALIVIRDWIGELRAQPEVDDVDFSTMTEAEIDKHKSLILKRDIAREELKLAAGLLTPCYDVYY